MTGYIKKIKTISSIENLSRLRWCLRLTGATPNDDDRSALTGRKLALSRASPFNSCRCRRNE
jgi:hypothetical protein